MNLSPLAFPVHRLRSGTQQRLSNTFFLGMGETRNELSDSFGKLSQLRDYSRVSLLTNMEFLCKSSASESTVVITS